MSNRLRIPGLKNRTSGVSESTQEVPDEPSFLGNLQPLSEARRHLEASYALDALGRNSQERVAHIPVSRVPATQNRHSVMRTNETVHGGHALRGMMQTSLAQLADSGFSEQSQHEFIKQFCREAKIQWQPVAERGRARIEQVADESMHDLAWMASTLRKVVPHPDVSLDRLNEFFGDHGFKLRTFDKIDGKQQFAHLDRRAFRNTLREIRDRKGKVCKGDMNRLLGQLSHVVDLDDMKWAQSHLRKRVMAGHIEVPKPLEAEFNAFMALRIDTNAEVGEIALQARALRFALKSGDANAIADHSDKFDAMVKSAAANTNNPDALFFAGRVIKRELGKCGNNPLAHKLCAGFSSEIARRSRGKLDRYAMNQKIAGMLARGEITKNAAYVMRVGVVTSVTNVELHQTLNFFEESLKLEIANAIGAMFQEVNETIIRNMSDNIYDRESERRSSEARAIERDWLNNLGLRETIERMSHSSKQVLLRVEEVVVRKVNAATKAAKASAYRGASSSFRSQAAAAVNSAEQSELGGRAGFADGAAKVIAGSV
ncbi:MAG: hypothetical protein H7Z43_15695 [Clostridia bacterium]|nr:hypothetical protein [Deltaproteobacteria bacterium]